MYFAVNGFCLCWFQHRSLRASVNSRPNSEELDPASRNMSDTGVRLRNISESRDMVEPAEPWDSRQQNTSRQKDAADPSEKAIKEKSENSSESVGVEQRLDQLARLVHCMSTAHLSVFSGR
jgi:hypothetical protein